MIVLAGGRSATFGGCDAAGRSRAGADPREGVTSADRCDLAVAVGVGGGAVDVAWRDCVALGFDGREGAALVTVPLREKSLSCGLPTTSFCAGVAVFCGACWANAGAPAINGPANAATMIRERAFMFPAIR